MEKYISVEVLPLEELFSNRFRFHLSWFQRAYAWDEEHVARLLADVLGAMEATNRRYCLGHIRLAKPAGRPDASIIDGQQRAITLTILFALLRDLAAGTAEGARLEAAIFEKGNSARRVAAHFRLTPQPSVAPLLERCVQAGGSTLIEHEADVTNLSESERHIVANRNHLRAMLAEKTPGPRERVALAQFLLANCCVIVEAIENEQEALTMLATEEETGLSHHSSERAKTTLISMMPKGEREQAGRLWEGCQARLGSEELLRLLGHLRALKLRRRSKELVETDLVQAYRLDRTGIEFLQRELVPRAELLASILERAIGEGTARTEISEALETLSWLDHQRWLPPALHWLIERGPAHRETALFFRRLERLAWLLKLSGTDPTEVENRFMRLIADIDRNRSPSRMKELDADPRKLTAALANLRSRTFYMKQYCGLVLRRLCREAGLDPGPIKRNGSMTVEHVLPHNPQPGSTWLRTFKSEAMVAEHVNRFGNLACLTFEDNQLAANKDYAIKRAILAHSGCPFTARLAATHETWGPESILARTEALIEDLFRKWELPAR